MPRKRYTRKPSFGNLRHGYAKHGQRSRTWTIWCGMIDRCRRKTNKSYPHYGGRGITVCERWKKFENFLEDMGECPPGLTIERIKNHLGYEPGNCKWATHLEQNRNTRKNVFIEFRGQIACIAEIAAKYGIDGEVAWHRIKYGWDFERVFTEPVHKPRSL